MMKAVAAGPGAEENITVVVRARPLLAKDLARAGNKDTGEPTLSAQKAEPSGGGEGGAGGGSAAASSHETVMVRTGPLHAASFRCDAFLGASVDQEAFFHACGVKRLVRAAVDGYCGTVFAYGQTGAGKTHTMAGAGREGDVGLALGAVAPEGVAGGGGGKNAAAAADATAAAAAAPAAAGAAAAAPPPRSKDGIGGGDGLIFRCARYLFETIRKRPRRRCSVRVTAIEIYNEQVSDLLAPPRESGALQGAGQGGAELLKVREHASGTFYVDGLVCETAETLQELLGVAGRALRRRQVQSTRLNERSTRSHCMLSIHVDAAPVEAPAAQQQQPPPPGSSAGSGGQMKKGVGGSAGGGGGSAPGSAEADAPPTFGKLTLVDLAGSERLRASDVTEGVDGALLRETGHINKSLYVLGKVIAALTAKAVAAAAAAAAAAASSGVRKAKGQKPKAEVIVPFRDSKLTKLLMGSIGGRSITLMLACCSSAPDQVLT